MDGREFLASLPEQPTPERDQRIYEAIVDGHHAPMEFKRIELASQGKTGSIEVMLDALKVGDTNPVRVSVRHVPTAQKLADHFGQLLPTALISDQTWLQADRQLEPCLQEPDSRMAYTSRMVAEHDQIEAEAKAKGARPGELLAPVGKDWCNTRRLIGRPDRSAEYGAQSPKAVHQGVTPGVRVWQPGPSLAHVAGFSDYMTGKLRFWKRRMQADGAERDAEDVARDPALCWLISSEGTLPALRHPGLARPGEETGDVTVDTVRPPNLHFS